MSVFGPRVFRGLGLRASAFGASSGRRLLLSSPIVGAASGFAEPMQPDKP